MKKTAKLLRRRKPTFAKFCDDKSVDAVVIATCNHWHAPATILACAAGKHVYVEKPCSHNPREGEMMVAAARKHKRHRADGQPAPQLDEVIEAIELVLQDGDIGRLILHNRGITTIAPSIGQGKPAEPPKGLNYDLWQGPAPAGRSMSNYLHYNWHWFWHWGNGELGNNGIHSIDLCRWGLGVDYPIRVTSARRPLPFRGRPGNARHAHRLLPVRGRKQIMWEGLSCSRQAAPAISHAVFHGEQGTLAIADNEYIIHDLAGKEPKTMEPIRGGDDFHFNNFLAAIRRGDTLNSEIEEGHKSTLLCHLGNIAQRTGRSLQCDPKNGQILNDKQAMAFWTRVRQGLGADGLKRGGGRRIQAMSTNKLRIGVQP